jgi:hypothetical protein
MRCDVVTQKGEEAAIVLLNKLTADCIAAGTVEQTDYSSAAQIDDDAETAATASDADNASDDSVDSIDSDIEYDMLDDVLLPEATAAAAAAATANDNDTVATAAPAVAVAEKVVLGERERERTREMTARLRAGLSVKEYCI